MIIYVELSCRRDSLATYLRLQIIVFCLAVIAILWLTGERRKTERSGADLGIYTALLHSVAAMLFIDFFCWYLDGKSLPFGKAIFYTVNILYYSIHVLPVSFFVLYADFQIFRDDSRYRKLLKPFLFITVFTALIALSSPITGFFFTIDDANRYIRGPYFFIFALIQYGIVLYALIIVIYHFRKISRRVFITLLLYPLPVLIAGYMQILFFGTVLVWPVATLFLLGASNSIQRKRARTDYLTGTANRRSLDEELESRLAWIKPGTVLCGLMIDLDDFKLINDRFGHETGDQALEDAAMILKTSSRLEDFIARMGGDEFVILLNFNSDASIDDVILRIENNLAEYNSHASRKYNLSFSIGRICTGFDQIQHRVDFLSQLDTDMYRRKNEKKKQIK